MPVLEEEFGSNEAFVHWLYAIERLYNLTFLVLQVACRVARADSSRNGCLLRPRLLLLQLEHNDPGAARQSTGSRSRLLLDLRSLVCGTCPLTPSRSQQLHTPPSAPSKPCKAGSRRSSIEVHIMSSAASAFGVCKVTQRLKNPLQQGSAQSTPKVIDLPLQLLERCKDPTTSTFVIEAMRDPRHNTLTSDCTATRQHPVLEPAARLGGQILGALFRRAIGNIIGEAASWDSLTRDARKNAAVVRYLLPYSFDSLR